MVYAVLDDASTVTLKWTDTSVDQSTITFALKYKTSSSGSWTTASGFVSNNLSVCCVPVSVHLPVCLSAGLSVCLSACMSVVSVMSVMSAMSVCHVCHVMGWWCSGILLGLLRRRSVVRFPVPPTLEKCAKGICLCNLLRSTQPNDRETVIEG